MATGNAKLVALRPEGKDALVRLAELLTPKYYRRITFADAIIAAERICRDALTDQPDDTDKLDRISVKRHV